MITAFDPVKLAQPLQSTVDAYQAATNSPAIVARITGPNQTAVDAAGVSDTATGRPATPDQSFEIGSQTKMMTATIILQLVGEGKINLDAAAGTYLDAATKDGIANIDTATVRNLLNMKSGIDDFTTVPGTTEGIPAFIQAVLDNPEVPFTAKESLDLVRDLPALIAPGTEFSYSNTNYTLLGQIVEEVSGKTFSQNLQERIFTPVGMTNSTTDEAPADANRLHQYITDLEGNVYDVTESNWKKGAEGGVVSTTQDMTKFIKALLIDKTLLPANLLAEMTTLNNADTSTPEGQSTFGLGISAFNIDGIGWVTGFTGGTLGTDSSTYVDLATGRIISVGITNTEASSPVLARDIWLATKDDPWGPISFNPLADTLEISSASAAEAILSGATTTTLNFGEAAVTLPVATGALTSSNVIFKDGSVLIIGDNTAGDGDGGANTIDIASQFAPAFGKNNQIFGLSGDDVLLSGAGDDRIDGGEGNDAIRGGAGNDRILDGMGNDTAYGGAGRDVFTASVGDDRYNGGAGADTVIFSAISNAVSVNLDKGTAQGAGRDTLRDVENVTGSDFADRLGGDDRGNILLGLAGNDTLWGAGGRDTVAGGLGRDVFDFDAAAETGISTATRDVIRDFRASFDRIDLSGIDSKPSLDGDQAFRFVGTDAFHGVAGELRFKKIDPAGRSDDRTVISGDTGGDGKADFQIELSGLINLAKGDFIL